MAGIIGKSSPQSAHQKQKAIRWLELAAPKPVDHQPSSSPRHKNIFRKNSR
jgi:hypothetical protein